MNTNTLAKHYDRLTPEERFRLILAAGARGDDAEQGRLKKAGGRITLSVQDHVPYAHAFNELALMTYIELLEEAALYTDAFFLADDSGDLSDGEDDGKESCAEVDVGSDVTADEAVVEDDASEMPTWQLTLDLALAAGFVLRTKADGWKLFCERLTIPPFAVWQIMPGFERLQRALRLAERVAFVPEGVLKWLNHARPAGEPELTEIPFTAEGLADALAKSFHERVRFWGG